jgi:hypothetical protein
MENAHDLRARAERYRQMRSTFSDTRVQEVLEQLAEELDLQAAELAARSPEKGKID